MMGYGIYIIAFAAWITHIVVAIQTGSWMFMIAGALVAPVAIAHGVSVWFGFAWV